MTKIKNWLRYWKNSLADAERGTNNPTITIVSFFFYVHVSIKQANEVSQKWVDDYNHERPHQSLNYQTPMAYAA